MSGFTYTIALRVARASDVGRATAAVGKLEGEIKGVHHSLNQARDAQGRFISSGRRGFRSLTNSVSGLIARVGAAKLAYDALKVSADLESSATALDFSTAGQGAENLKFLTQTTDALKVSFRASLPAFQNWMGAVRGTSLEGQQSRDIFYAVAEASRVAGVSTENTSGVFLALSQMASKGKVSAEELRQQLGERLPGALSIAARAMGVTQEALNKMMENGELYSDKFLPRFAAQLHKEFGGGVTAALKTANARFAELDNSVFRLQNSIGQHLVPMAITLVERALIPAAEWIGRNAEIIPIVASAALGAAVAMKALAVATAFSAASGGFFTKVMAALNITMAMNPIGLVVVAIAALSAAVVTAWKTSEEWRGRLTGVWEAMKATASAIWKFLIAPSKIAAKLIDAALTFDLSKMKSALSEAMTIGKNVGAALTTDVAKAYYEGEERGKAKFRVQQRLKDRKQGGDFKAPDLLSAAFKNTPTAGPASDPAAAAADDKVRRGVSQISSGGARMKNISIEIGKLVENINLYAASASQGIDDLGDELLKKLVQVINNAQHAQ